ERSASAKVDQRIGAGGDHDHVAQCCELRTMRLERRGHLGRADDADRARIAEDLRRLAPGERGIRRIEGAAGPEDSPPGLEERRAVRQDDRHHVAVAYPELAEPCGDLSHTPPELAVRPPERGFTDEGLVAKPVRPGLAERSQGLGADREGRSYR